MVKFAIRFFIGIVFIIASPMFFIISFGFDGYNEAKEVMKDIITMKWMEQI